LVFGNLSTGYWLGAAATAGLHWVELGRTTLTGASGTIAVGLTGKWFEQDTSRFSVDTTNSEVDFSCGRDGSNNAITYDLGSNLSGTWVMRYVMNFSTNTASAENWFWVGLTDKNSSIATIGSTLDGFGGFIMYEQAIDAKERHGMSSSTAAGVTEHQAYDTNVVFSTGTDYYCELIRTGTTTGTFTIRTGSHTGTVHNAYSYSGGNNATNLRYLRVSDLIDSAGGTGDMAGTLSAITIDDNATSYSSADYTVEFTKNPAKPYMMVLGQLLNSTNGNLVVNFNNDAGSNYIDRRSENGGSDVTTTARTNTIFSDALGVEFFTVGNIINESGQEKLMFNQMTDMNSSGAATAPDRWETVNKWANTSDSITSFKATCNQTMALGSEVVVLGYAPEDTEGTSVWEELGTTEGTGSEDTLSVTVNKKYLMFEMYKVPNGDTSADLQFNSDTGANYAWRISSEGSSDASSSSGQTRIVCDRGAISSAPSFVRGFIINTAAKEKLVMSEAIAQETAGAGTAPGRRELVGKWANTSGAITSVDMVNAESGSFNTGSYLKVWGFD
jgi:hypothetical protein